MLLLCLVCLGKGLNKHFTLEMLFLNRFSYLVSSSIHNKDCIIPNRGRISPKSKHQWLSLGVQEEMLQLSPREGQGRDTLKEIERHVKRYFVLCLLDWLEEPYWFYNIGRSFPFCSFNNITPNHIVWHC